MESVSLGVDEFLKKEIPDSQSSWGLVTSDACKTSRGSMVRMELLQHGYNIKYLFSPEHGLSSKGIDGAWQPDQIDPLTRLPVYSLYGNRLKPMQEILRELDGVIFDLPDIGVRFYTYIWTMSLVMESCDASGKTLIILDRPNPLSGQLNLAEGPMLDEKNLSSFLGRWSIPIRHNLTIGELAKFWKKERNLSNLNLKVIPCTGWKRSMYLEDTGLPFYPPSPAITQMETILTYPALCFLEGTNLNEGRGTDLPFRQFGAPWLDSSKFMEILKDYSFPGVNFKAVSFLPKSGRYAKKYCHGAQMIISNRSDYRPIQTGIKLIALLNLHYPNHFEWADYPTLVNETGARHIDLLLGNTDLVMKIEQDPKSLIKEAGEWSSVEKWEEKVSGFLTDEYKD
ncbi:MAG: DUF1343 domain-containing protein [Bacteroidetes bacterium]|nr:MAG: DUF1343 domain-containing protein [Bacteroidota bacterium]